MVLFIVLCCIILLVLLITWARVNAFLAFLSVSLVAAFFLGIPIQNIAHTVQKGIAETLGSLVVIIVMGAMLGKLVAESGAAQRITSVLMGGFGEKNIPWALMLTGFVVGIPLFYNVGFVLMVPLIFSVVYQYRLPAVSTGLPMLAALSVTHGFLPPHPSPSALVIQFHANMGQTLLYGLLLAVPAIILAGPLFSRTLKNIPSVPLQTFTPRQLPESQLPGSLNSFLTALIPVILLALTSLFPFFVGANSHYLPTFSFVGDPIIVMTLALVVSTFSLGIAQGKKMAEIMKVYEEAVRDVTMIILVVAGAGILKQVFVDSGVSQDIGARIQSWPIHPLILAWLIAAIIRVCMGSATVAGLTAAGIISPMMVHSPVNPSLMVLSIGAGSLMFSHVNDAGFWMFKEYFNLTIKDTIRSWSLMETIVSVTGLVGVLLLNIFLH